MSTISLTFLIPTVYATSEERGDITLLEDKGFVFEIEPYDEGLSGITIDESFHRIMEFFYIMKDALIRRVPETSDTRDGEIYDRYTLEVYMPSTTIPLLIGKGGTAIESLRKMSFAKITVHDNDDSFENKGMLSFEGDELAIPQSFHMTMVRILNLLPRIGWTVNNPHRMANITDNLVDPNTLVRSDNYSKLFMMSMNPKLMAGEVSSFEQATPLRTPVGTESLLSFMLPNKRVGTIIGSSGATINTIRTETNTQISISKHVRGLEDRRVDITGTLDSVYAACGQVIKQLAKSTDG